MICTADIETLPGTFRSFANKWWEASLMREETPVKLASISVKPLHLKTAKTIAYWQYPSEKAFLKAVHALLEPYEYVIGHNIRKFDIRELNAQFVPFGIKRLNYKPIDTLTAVRREFNFPTYKLKYVLRRLGIGMKLETGGEALWFAVEAGDKKARTHFLRYNENDTLQTEALYIYLRDLGYIKDPTKRTCFNAKEGCIRCGSDNVVKRGEKPYANGMYQMVSCNDCNKHQPHYLVRPWGVRA